ncbi:hypothetical protein EIN_359690 [Entamoeba invadens IP1]|uniref:DNA recombination and repair protein Rad51-like C-terminal domain-containing protein n=1 Tax=Entamoeba invadens IP1 TaxID=370355 RepID=A0A0A1UB94_ENTIV|nr:hypothetical protein EIN_359690 [Entamoeba invadens IP1]ELP90876.1 hypothetical protein EIN_359690 [Entamoeba invadens IP1]|eukprot:XP_004257647.1 hypothetical protein EIN_359690 [Entamoeba invadens IP1]
MLSITGSTHINDPILSTYLDPTSSSVLLKAGIKTVDDFIKTPLIKISPLFVEPEKLSNFLKMLCCQIVPNRYTLLDYADNMEHTECTTGIPAIDSALPTRHMETGKIYDLVGTVDSLYYRVLVTIACCFIKQTSRPVLWIDTIRDLDFDIVYDVIVSQLELSTQDAHTYFKQIHVVVEHSLINLINTFNDSLNECGLVIFNSLSSLTRHALSLSSPLYKHTVKFINTVSRIAEQKKLVVINMNFLQYEMSTDKQPHLVTTIDNNLFYQYANVQVLLLTGDNQVSAQLTKPRIVFLNEK